MEKIQLSKKFIVLFLFLGIFSILAQVILVREILVNFYGNEFFIGFVFFSWMLWTFLGSFLFALVPKPKNFKTLLFLPPLILLFQIFALRLTNFFNKTGQLPSLKFSFSLSFFLMAPLCFLVGFLFPYFLSLFKKEKEDLIAKAYFWETAGFIIGGIIFNFFLFRWLEIWSVIILFLIVGILLLRFKFFKLAFVIFLIILTCIFFSEKISLWTNGFKYQNQKILEVKNTPYQRIVIGKIFSEKNEQINFFGNGNFLFSNQKDLFSEVFHLPFLYNPKIKNVLLIGKGEEGIIRELLKEKIENLFYLKDDFYLFSIILDYKLLPQDKRIKILKYQPEKIFQENQKFDLVILNFSLPTTISLNRFYTKEFFGKFKEILSPRGILFFTFPSTFAEQNLPLNRSNSVIFTTLKKVFPNLLALKSENNIFYLGSKDIKFSEIPQKEILANFQRLNLKTIFFNQAFLSLLEKKNLNLTTENSIKNPRLLFLANLARFSQLSERTEKILALFLNIDFLKLFLLFNFLILLLIFLLKDKKEGCLFSIFCASFTLMSLEILLVYFYQNYFGNVFYKISLILTFIMTGILIGNYFSRKILLKGGTIYLFFSFLAFVALSFSFDKIPSVCSLIKNGILLESLLGILGIISGFILGFIFPILAKIYEKDGGEISKFYAFDILGGAFGAILPSFLFLPILGLDHLIILLIVFNIVVAFYLLLAKR